MNNQDRLIIEKEQLNDLVNTCQEEIRRLKDRIDFYEDIESDRLAYIDELEKENQRLNNVLNELEKWLKSEVKRLEKIQNDTKNVKPYGQEYNNYTFLIGAYDNVLDKLNELKKGI